MAAQTEMQKMLAGEPYDGFDSDLVMARTRARELCQGMVGMNDKEIRRICCELFGGGGESVIVTPPFYCDYGANIELGERVYFNYNCVVLDCAPVKIGAFTLFGPGVQVYTPVHPLDPVERRKHEWARPVEIGADCWIGGGAIILPGVRIGAGTTIGAGSVVTKDVPEGVLAVGNPCRVLRKIG